MDLIEQILNQAKNLLICPVCSGHYNTGEIKFRGFIDNTYIFQAYCSKGHEPMAVTYLAALHKMENPISTYFHPLSGEKITKEMADEAEVFIASFDGDFKKYWDGTNS
ncbi:MAG: hypothetical protein NTZ65_02730 [Candidatus Berkelbacteria bacterium]|nr:hypothetical protein [Candidatus Berkelbacteria bacterium]